MTMSEFRDINRVEEPRTVGTGRAVAWLLLAAVMIAAPAWAQVNSGGKQPQGRSPYSQLKKPKDPSKIAGTWMVGEKEHSITAGEFYARHELLTKLNASVRRAISPNDVWTDILLRSEADGFGLIVTAEELNAKLQRDDPDIYEGLLARWRNQGVTQEQGVAYTRGQLKIQKLKDMFLNTQRVTTRQAFDQFKKDRLLYKFEYVRFAEEDYHDLVKMDEVDDVALRTFWTDNRMIQARFRQPASVTAEFVYLDPSAITVEEARSMSPDKKITRKEALEYFWKHRAELMNSFPADKQHLLNLDEDTPLEEIVSPFSILEDTINKKLLVAELLERAFADAQAEAARGKRPALEAIAKKYRLGHKKVVKLPRARSIAELRLFGFGIFNALNASTPNALTPEIKNEGQISYFYFLDERQESRLPKFADVKEDVRKAYRTFNADSIARDRARKAMTDLTTAVQKDLLPLQKELEAQARQDAKNRAQALGLSNPNDIRREEIHAQAKARRKLEEEKKKRLPTHYEAWRENLGRKVYTTPFFEFEQQRINRNDMEDLEASRLLFLKSSYYIRSLQAGDVTAILLEDPTTHAFFIGRLVERRDPDVATMSPVDLMQAKAQLEQLAESRFQRRWRYSEIQRRLQLNQSNQGR